MQDELLTPWNAEQSEREDVAEIVSHLQDSELEERYLALFDKACRCCSQDMLAFLDSEKQRIKNKYNEELKTLSMEIDAVKGLFLQLFCYNE